MKKKRVLSANIMLIKSLLRDMSNRLDDMAFVMDEIYDHFCADRLAAAAADLDAVREMASARNLPPYLDGYDYTTTGHSIYSGTPYESIPEAE